MSKNSYIRLGKQNRDFAVLPNQLLRDKGLSFRDIGILASILSHDPTWLVHVWEMSRPRESREGPHAVRSSLKRLRSIGYVSLVLERQPNGTLHSVYYVYSNPKDNDQPDVLFGSIKPNTEKRHQVKMQTAPDAEKRYPVNLQNTPDGVSPDAVQPDSGKRNAARPDAVNRHAKEVPSLRSIDSTKKQQQKAMTENAKAEKTKIAAVAAVVVQLEKDSRGRAHPPTTAAPNSIGMPPTTLTAPVRWRRSTQ